MQSIEELAHVITDLDASDQRALLDKVAQLNVQKARDNGADSSFQVMQEAMKDELFLADMREVMEDFRHVDAEETPADTGTLDRLAGEPRSRRWFRTRQDVSSAGLERHEAQSDFCPSLMYSLSPRANVTGASIRTKHRFLPEPPDLTLSQLFSVIRFAHSTNSGSSSASVRWSRQTCAPRSLLLCGSNS